MKGEAKGEATSAAQRDAKAVNGEVLLSVQGVSLKLGGNLILNQLAFDVVDRIRPGTTTGQLVGLLGPSGVGKTRLIRLIAGLDQPDAGTIAGKAGAPLLAGRVGVVFQDYALLRHRTAEDNLIVAGVMNGLSGAESTGRARELLDKFRLGDRGAFYPAQLSGGQRQRVAIAQQLVVPKSLLLMDEPFSGLDPVALDEVVRLIVEVTHLDELNTVVIVTHDVHSALLIADTVLMLGRDHDAEGRPIPGARIQQSYDMVERGLCWRQDLDSDPAFNALYQEIRERFRGL